MNRPDLDKMRVLISDIERVETSSYTFDEFSPLKTKTDVLTAKAVLIDNVKILIEYTEQLENLIWIMRGNK
ncbi:MAG: hypothetical protein QXL01_01580 [Thermoplasmatales archaeon]